MVSAIDEETLSSTQSDDEYSRFLKNKVKFAEQTGFELTLDQINPALKPHNKLMVQWMVRGGRRACFAKFGLHKTVTQLEVLRCTLLFTGGRALIICPLGVRQEFIKDARKILKWEVLPKFIRSIEEAGDTGIYITNYETVRDGKLDPRQFNVSSLDEASVLRGFGGSKTFREFMRLFTGDSGPKVQNQVLSSGAMIDLHETHVRDSEEKIRLSRFGTEFVPYRFVATATPSPNDYIELLAYADFLGIMDISQAKTRFFKRDSTQADKLTLHKHKEEEFWLWVSSWALFVSKPSDITGNHDDDKGYIMPDIDLRWHELESDHSTATFEKSGQGKLYKDIAIGVTDAAREKRESLPFRIKKLLELRAEDPSAHRIIWHDLEAERHAIEKAIPSCATVYGTQKIEDREQIISAFSEGEIPELAGKPSMIGSGTNLQMFCSWAIYLGIGFKFNDFIQSIHRLVRFLQKNRVRVDILYTDAEREVRRILEGKWEMHIKQEDIMAEINKKYGLSIASMTQILTRKMGIERIEVTGEKFTVVQNDNVQEAKKLKTNSVGLILTSWPFSNQYEYSPNYADFGHSENTGEFFRQMDFLTPELYRGLIPGRIYALHVKDRIIPGGMNGLGFQTVYPFHIECITHMIKHGFGYMGMKTIVTDVVRENNQTYRLGWTEQCKDGSKMGVGMPEYLLLFRKPPTDSSKAYSDIPVLKEKKDWIPEYILAEDGEGNLYKDKIKGGKKWVNPKGYSRARWQMDAAGYTRSSGDRLLDPKELKEMDHHVIYKLFRDFTLNEIWDFDHVVNIAEKLEEYGKLPSGFMLLQPQSWSDHVWADITRMLTLNSSQWSKGKEMHLCPFQIDLVQRVVRQMSNPGDICLDPFSGLGTVPKIAIEEDRYGIGWELNPSYFIDSVQYCKAAEVKKSIPTLFDALSV